MMLNSSSVCYCYALFSSCVDPATCVVFKSASEIVFFFLSLFAGRFVCLSAGLLKIVDQFFLPPTTEEVNAIAGVCLSVCLSVSKINQNAWMNLDQMLRVMGHGGTD